MLSHISISHPLHFGLPIQRGSHYCSLEQGVVLSNTVLASTAASLEWCVSHTDVNADNTFGLCVLHGAALPCSSRIQEKDYVSMSLDRRNGGAGSEEVYDSLQQQINDLPSLPVTITDMQQPIDIYAAHQLLLVKEIDLLKESLRVTREKIAAVRPKAPLTAKENTWPLGSPAPHNAKSRFDIISWTAFNSSHVFMPDEHRNVAPLRDNLLRDITSVVLAGASHVTNTSDGRLILQHLNYGYYKVDPVRGTDYLLSLQFRDAFSGEMINKFIEGSRSITSMEFIPMPYVTEKTEITLIVPVRVSETGLASDFLKKFVKNKKNVLNSVLLFVVILTDKNGALAVKKLRSDCESVSSESELNVKLATVASNKKVSHVSLMDQVVRKLSSDTLAMIVPVMASVSSAALDRAKMNTIQGWQVFSPMAWGMYHPKVIPEGEAKAYADMDVRANIGHFLRYDFTSIAFYLSDYKKARKMSSRLFPIVSSSSSRFASPSSHPPLSVYRLFLAFSNLHVIRAPEPYIRLPYTSVECPKSSPAPKKMANPLESDLSLLMGSSKVDNNAAFYRYVINTFLQDDNSSSGGQLSASDFIEDELCEERQVDSFGSRIQLNRIIMEYDEKNGEL